MKPIEPHLKAAQEYLARNPSAKYCPICGVIYFCRFAPVLTTLTVLTAALIGVLIAHLI